MQIKESGFSDYRYIAHLAATELGFYVVRNPENKGISQDDFEGILENDYPVFIFIVGEKASNVVNREFNIAKEKCLPILVFIKGCDGKIPRKTTKILENLSKYTYDYCCTIFNDCEDLYVQVYRRLSNYIREKASKYPRLEKDVSLAYNANRRLLSKSRRQIIIYQKTSILVLGPRKAVKYENEFYKELMDWLTKSKEKDVK